MDPEVVHCAPVGDYDAEIHGSKKNVGKLKINQGKSSSFDWSLK